MIRSLFSALLRKKRSVTFPRNKSSALLAVGSAAASGRTLGYVPPKWEVRVSRDSVILDKRTHRGGAAGRKYEMGSKCENLAMSIMSAGLLTLLGGWHGRQVPTNGLMHRCRTLGC